MELGCNWHAFQSVFQSDPERRRSLARVRGAPSLEGRVFLVSDGQQSLSVFSDCPSLSRECQKWVGSSIVEIEAAFPGRQIVVFEEAQVDKWMTEVSSGKHVLEQFAKLRERAIGSAGGPSKLAFSRHFFLEGLETWWSRVLPSSYGVFIRIEGEPSRPQERSLLLIVRRGKIESYDEPDLSTLGSEQAKNPSDVVRHVSERYRLPVQGVFVTQKDWSDWSQGPGAWRKVAAAIKNEDAKLIPFRWSLASLIATRAYFGI